MRVSGNFAAVANYSFPSQRCSAVVHLTRHYHRDHTLVLNCDILFHASISEHRKSM